VSGVIMSSIFGERFYYIFFSNCDSVGQFSHVPFDIYLSVP
jgi:hypothetical protein